MVELDEELHFNRYRARTLQTSWSTELPWSEAYLRQSEEYEADCLRAGRWGKRWTNSSTARMFTGGEPGDLAKGSPRWKQRALYDSLKDLIASVEPGIRLARVSIYDHIDGELLENALEAPSKDAARRFRSLVEERTVEGPV